MTTLADLKCPFYGNTTGCTDECLFMRTGGCAIILSAINSEDNNARVEELENQVSNMENKLDHAINLLNQLLSKK